MSSGTTFFICACAILLFSIINYKLAPIINGRVGYSWGLLNCAKMSDDYDSAREANPDMSDEQKETFESDIRKCRNRKAMHDMEHTSIVFNGVIGFICVLLGLYGLQKEVIPKTGTIGMACGVVGLILTLVYVIYNGVVYTNYYDSHIYKVDGDGAFAELDGDSFECFYYKESKGEDAILAKYSDLIKSQYNYNKDLKDSFTNDQDKVHCQSSPSVCETQETIPSMGSTCKKLYFKQTFNTYENYDQSARFLTALLLSIITLLCYCGLIFSGFTLSKE